MQQERGRIDLVYTTKGCVHTIVRTQQYTKIKFFAQLRLWVQCLQKIVERSGYECGIQELIEPFSIKDRLKCRGCWTCVAFR